jgi:hypothetical protein
LRHGFDFECDVGLVMLRIVSSIGLVLLLDSNVYHYKKNRNFYRLG